MSKKLDELKAELEALNDEIDYGDWRPLNSSGQQITPGQIRGAIRKHIAQPGVTLTKFLSEIEVNSSSYGRFMNQKYKNPWSAADNGTYWSAAKYFAIKKIQDKIDELTQKKEAKAEAKAKGKRTIDEIAAVDVFNNENRDVNVENTKKKSKSEIAAEINAIIAVPVPDPCPVYANCDEMRNAINRYLTTSGVPPTTWLKAINVAPTALNRFREMKGKGAGASNSIYPAAWRFLEQKRILEGKPKSSKRLEQEKRWGEQGFPLEHDDGKRLIFRGEPIESWRFDIEACRDKYNESH